MGLRSFPDDVTSEQEGAVRPEEITSIVAAWQASAISRDTMTELFRRGEVLPDGRTVEEEVRLIGGSNAVEG